MGSLILRDREIVSIRPNLGCLSKGNRVNILNQNTDNAVHPCAATQPNPDMPAGVSERVLFSF